MSEAKDAIPDWRMVRFNTDGSDLIYETPGDQDRGNPLDIIAVATVYGGRDVVGFQIPKKAFLKELQHRWNAWPEVVDALKLAEVLLLLCMKRDLNDMEFSHQQQEATIKEHVDMARIQNAIAKATGARS